MKIMRSFCWLFNDAVSSYSDLLYFNILIYILINLQGIQ
jgi:hypothetical protein